MKKIIFLVIVVASIIFIYLITKDKKIYYLSLGDELLIGYNSQNNKEYNYTDYVTEYLKNNNKLEKQVNGYYKENIRTIDLINMINNNQEIIVDNKKITIQNSLIKADLVTLSIGNNDLISKLTLYEIYSDEDIYNYIDEFILDLDKLLLSIRKYCKEKIIFIGYYNIINNKNINKYYTYLINKTKKITKKYNIEYVDIFEEFDKNEFRSKNLYPNKEGYTFIGQEIVKIIDK